MVLKIFSILLVLAGTVILGLTFYPAAKLELTYKPATATSAEIVPVDTELGIVIPKIGANAKIVQNVDAFDSAAYQTALTYGVAHAAGTSLPGDQGNAFLFSHSSADFFEAMKYNSVFYLLSKLETGDAIYIYRDGHKLTFTVTAKKMVAADAVEYLNIHSTKSSLTLMTCWPPGTDLKRVLVEATLDLGR